MTGTKVQGNYQLIWRLQDSVFVVVVKTTNTCKVVHQTGIHGEKFPDSKRRSNQNGRLRVPGNWFGRLPILWAVGKSWRKVGLRLRLPLYFHLYLYLYSCLYLYLVWGVVHTSALENVSKKWVCICICI